MSIVSTAFISLLTLIMITLKLAQVGLVASWSWWLVLAPIWIPWSVFGVFCAFAVLVLAVRKVWRR